MRFRWVSLACAVTVGVACGSHGSDSATAPGSDAGGGPPIGGGDTHTGGTVPDSAGLPPLPLMTHVTAVVHGNVATIGFDPVASAKDYRAYLLPSKADVRLNADGSLDGVNNAIYRCAGARAAPSIFVEGNGGSGDNPVPDWIAVTSMADGKQVNGYTRPLTEATLGYAFQDATPDTIPVYAVGDPAATGDNFGYGIREVQTREKLYVTDPSSYVAKGWRNDGVVFYAPSSATSHACGGTPITVHTTDSKQTNGTAHLFYASAGEVASRGAGTDAFLLCPDQATGASAVMRTYYKINSPGGVFGGESGHDELALGAERFARTRCQGSTFSPCEDASQSLWEIQWSNITEPQTLVVEALDAGCPFPGLLAATPVAALPVTPDDNNGDTSLVNDRLFTFDELKAKATHGEVFLNGQYDPTSKPHPIARAALDLAPQARPPMDFETDFAGHPESFQETFNADGTKDCGLTPEIHQLTNNNDPCGTEHKFVSPTYESLFFDVDDKRFTTGVTLGELWTGYSGGKFRITPKNVVASMSDTTFLHAALEVSAFSTGRRYPQLIISQDPMIKAQWLVERSSRSSPSDINTNVTPTAFLHTIDAGVGRHVLELELCSHRGWQVNNHCPWFLLEKNDPATTTGVGTNNGHPDLFDRLQDDRNVRFDLFMSTQKAYVFVDSLPYACVDLAHRKAVLASGAPISPVPMPPQAGSASVAFGDVEYHAGAEQGYFQNYSSFHLNRMLYETVRHFDYFGFKSNEPAPPWDETAFPCITQMYDGGNAGTQTPESGN